jgi:UDP-N-acetylglucosamine 2-epimerase (non-hydrolysing)
MENKAVPIHKDKRIVIACIIGTRPEVIKMAPVILALQTCGWAEIVLINTAQHRQLTDEMLAIFDLKPDIDLNTMTPNQSLGCLSGKLCFELEALIHNNQFDLILGVGDTTTVFITALIAFYNRIPFAHIEAGLRSHQIDEPFPEEVNRVLTAPLATWHFVPTLAEKENLLKENINPDKILITGNTVIDALYWVIHHKPEPGFMSSLSEFIIVTTHRRENFGEHLESICEAIIQLTKRFKLLHFVIPVHPNPNVREKIERILKNNAQIHLVPPLKYTEFVQLMNRAILIMTDSGGIQEEAPALRKPLVILRKITERTAILEEDLGILSGTSTVDIVSAVTKLLTNKPLFARMSRGVSPYGDGNAANRIVEFIAQQFQASGSTNKNSAL